MRHVVTARLGAAGEFSRARILNAWVDGLSVQEIVEAMTDGILFTINPDHLYHLQRDRRFAQAYAAASVVSCDSRYLYWVLALIGRRLKHVACGSDIAAAYWRYHAADPNVRIFLLGARPGVARQAADRINALAGRDIVVGAHGPSMNFVNDPAECAEAIGMVIAAKATCLMVGLGAPKQEIWIAENRHRMPNVRLVMGVGASIDYEAGAVKRAPPWMRHGLEWVYRVVTEPRRYLLRYARTSEVFWLALLDGLGRYRPPNFDAPASRNSQLVEPPGRAECDPITRRPAGR